MTPSAALTLRRLRLTDVRSYERADLELGRGVTVLVGANGVGKTNLLEAAAVALAGASPRTSSELRLVRDGAAAARIAATVDVDGALHERAVVLDRARGKSLRLDGEVVRSVAAYAERTPTSVFLPERLLVVRGAPARRRALLDGLAARVVQGAPSTIGSYAKVVQQRNALLRRARAGAQLGDQLDPWDAQLIERAADLRRVRRELLAQLAEPYRDEFAQLTGGERGSYELLPRGADDLTGELEAVRAAELRRGSTLVGPHLDDVVPLDGARNLREFGSTGEQRASLLAFTLAGAELLARRTGTEPVVLLDEPWSELDADRRRRLSARLLRLGQVLCTTTEPPPELLDAARPVAVHLVRSGEIAPWTDAARTDDAPTPTSTSSASR